MKSSVTQSIGESGLKRQFTFAKLAKGPENFYLSPEAFFVANRPTCQ